MGVRSVRRLKQRPTSEPPFESPEERAARRLKATAIADVVEQHVRQLGAVDHRTALRVVRQLSDDARHAAAAAAGVRDPSPKTWGIVAVLVAHRIEHDADKDTDPFDGLPK